MRFDFDEKFFPQASHTCLASPECMCSMWDSMLLRWLNSLLQYVQWKGFDSVEEEEEDEEGGSAENHGRRISVVSDMF